MKEGNTLTPREVAEILKVDLATIYRLIHQGRLQSFRVGRQLRIDRKNLEDFIEKSKVGKK